MEAKEVPDQDLLFDLENGNCLLAREDSRGMEADSIARQERTMLNGSWNDLVSLNDDKNRHMSCCSSRSPDSNAKHGDCVVSEGEMRVGTFDNSVTDREKKKWSKKPPRPPRPPITSPLDPADQKLISELSELAVLKRARIERMKALKKMKSTKPASSTGSLVALIITVIFCSFILWQGIPVGKL
ncbi:hypothetical protein ACP70R_030028 [Stipagrostis hirtigluma subsp. patula]